MEEIAYYGYWYSPSNTEKKYYGSLDYAPNKGIMLKLYNIDELSRNDENLDEKYEILLGITSTGEKITLINCYNIQSNRNHNLKDSIIGMESKYVANYILIGKHYENIVDITFKSSSVQIQNNILFWLKNKGLKSRGNGTNCLCSYEQPESIHIAINDFNVSIESSIISEYSQKEYIFHECCVLFYNMATPVGFTDFLNIYILRLLNFFKFIFNSHINIDNIEFFD